MARKDKDKGKGKQKQADKSDTPVAASPTELETDPTFNLINMIPAPLLAAFGNHFKEDFPHLREQDYIKAPTRRQARALAFPRTPLALTWETTPWPSKHNEAPVTLLRFTRGIRYLRQHAMHHIQEILCPQTYAYWAPIIWDLYTETSRAVRNEAVERARFFEEFKKVSHAENAEYVEWPCNELGKPWTRSRLSSLLID